MPLRKLCHLKTSNGRRHADARSLQLLSRQEGGVHLSSGKREAWEQNQVYMGQGQSIAW